MEDVGEQRLEGRCRAVRRSMSRIAPPQPGHGHDDDRGGAGGGGSGGGADATAKA